MPWYFMLDLALWLMTIGVMLWAWPQLTTTWRMSAVVTALLVMPLQVLNEYLSLHVVFAWTFSLDHNKMIGWDIFGTPVEEYLFWFAFAWFCPFLYSGLVAYFNKKDQKQNINVAVVSHD